MCLIGLLTPHLESMVNRGTPLSCIRYRNVNVTFFRPHQVRELYDGTDVEYVNEIVRQSEQKGRKYGNWKFSSYFT